MTEVIAGPDVVGAVIRCLEDSPIARPAHGDVPSVRPGEFYRIADAGGPGTQNLRIYRSLVTVESWAATSHAAGENAREAAAYLEASEDFYEVVCSAPVNFPDPRSGSPRALMTADVALATVVL